MIFSHVPSAFSHWCGSAGAALPAQGVSSVLASWLGGLWSLPALVLMICDAGGLEPHQESISFTTVKMKWTDCFLFFLTDGRGHNEISTLGKTIIFHSTFPPGTESASWWFVCCHSEETQYYTLGRVTVSCFEGTGPFHLKMIKPSPEFYVLGNPVRKADGDSEDC